MPKKKKKKVEKASNVNQWLKRETPHKREALETASRHFDKEDTLTVNTLEAVYGQESSFGRNRRKRGIAGAAGDFHLERRTARRMGLTVTEKNDERFDVDNASAGSAKYLKILDRTFSKRTTLYGTLRSIPIKSANERKKFTLAAFNGGEGRIGRAQQATKAVGKDPTKWADVKKYLQAGGATEAKAKEIRDYVDKVLKYEREFSKKSKADKTAKTAKPKKVKKAPKGGHWVTVDDRPVFIEDK